MRLEENYVNYVRNAVNITVRNTGYPVLAKTLNEAGIASRKQLKILVRKGHLQEMKVRVNGGQILNAFFTEAEAPREFLKKVEQMKLAQQKAHKEAEEAVEASEAQEV